MANNYNDPNPNDATFAPTIVAPANPRVRPDCGQQVIQVGGVSVDTSVAATRIRASGLPIAVPPAAAK